MKKTGTLLMCAIMVFCLFSCGKEEEPVASTYEMAMITTSQSESIDDNSYNQDTWEGLKEYAEENEITYKYYEPTEASADARLEQIDQAVQSGAAVVVCCGEEFENVVHTAQEKYSDKTFILIDGYPTDKEGVQKTETNAVGVKFAEEELGYLAGYAAVEDGYRTLGFLGGSSTDSVKSYGYGFVQGCNAAARDMGVIVDINYNYKKDSDTAATVQKAAERWYRDGVEVIFACGDDVFDSVAAEADIAKRKVIGCGFDRSSKSKNIVTSAVKDCKIAVQMQLAAFYNGEFAGGENLMLGASDDAVNLAMKTSRFEIFEQENYDRLYRSLKSGKLKIAAGDDAERVSSLIKKKGLTSVDVTVASL